MWGHRFVLTLHILTLTCLSVGKAELCIDDGVEFEIEYASVGEPLYAVCPLYLLFEKSNFNVTWIRNGSQTEFTSDRQERVHQDQKYLKFIPAQLQDSGFYQCILKNSTFCIKKIRRVEVFNQDDGLCYNHSVRFLNEIPIMPSLRIECPDIDIYVNTRNIQVKWFKECQPLNMDSGRYLTLAKDLIIKSLSQQDSGNYTCEVSFMYNGVTYNISRAIEYSILDLPKEIEPVMTFPKNNILDVKLGDSITLTCEVFYNAIIDLYWTYNDTLMAQYTEDDRVIMGTTDKTITEDGIQNFLTLNFTKVLEEDYNKQFYCHIWSSTSTFYVTLRRPDGKMYDAYIMYPKDSMGTSSYEMDIFVLKVLPEVLEKQCAYRLFIIGRDDLPGQAMADLIDETISQSRRIIIVLGNLFCEKQGDDFEQKIAMYDALIRNKIKVILIEMEKITDYTDMPESLKYIKQKQGVVQWKGEFTESALSPNTRFWKNIRYQMPPAQRHSDKELHYIHSED
ncbi:interleukin-1 receptor type 1-like isoform X2 [Rhinoderma darwinii]|uniref:interleukin-1 receptor type 1-like isoform X2 n=1 Tax=Rhinoderma darwinii TaxID=43563 RepID=UPI003F6660D8